MNPALISAFITAGGALLNRAQSQGDIARQNAYNHPLNQVRRLRESGLPMAALTGGMAGAQSALPQTIDAGGTLNKYVTTQQQLQQLELVKEEIRLKRAEADKFSAERDWYLSGGQNGSTNLVNTLRTRLGMEQAQAEGQGILNKTNILNLQNTPYRQQLENIKLNAEIGNLYKSGKLIDEQISSAELNNRIQGVIAEYQPGMSKEQFNKLLKENQLLDLTKEGKGIENDIQKVRRTVERETEGTQITQRHQQEIMNQLTYDKVKHEFKTYEEYQEFVTEARKLFQADGSNFNPLKLSKRALALLYTTITGVTGSSPGATGTLLQGLK